MHGVGEGRGGLGAAWLRAYLVVDDPPPVEPLLIRPLCVPRQRRDALEDVVATAVLVDIVATVAAAAAGTTSERRGKI